MPSTFAEIKAEVALRLIDATADLTAIVPSLVNQAMRDFQEKMNYPCMKRRITFTTASETRLLGQMPDAFKAFRERPFWLDAQGSPSFMATLISEEDALKVYARQELVGLSPITDKGPPEALSPVTLDTAVQSGVTQVNVYPLPDTNGPQNGNYTIYIPYWGYLDDLTADGASNWFTVNGPYAVIYQAVAHGFMADWNEQRAALNFQIADGYVRKLGRLASMSAAQPMENIAVRADVYGERDENRRS